MGFSCGLLEKKLCSTNMQRKSCKDYLRILCNKHTLCKFSMNLKKWECTDSDSTLM